MRSNFRLFLTPLLLTALFFASCGPKSSTATRYHCPMHPSYVSETPGDCPICGMRLVPIEDRGAPTPTPVATPGAAKYICPMDPEVVADSPGRCPKCGMKLVRAPAHQTHEAHAPETAEASQVPGYAPVRLAPEGLAKAGVQTAVATPGKLGGTIRAVGVVVVDERLVRHVQTKVAGWVEKLFVNTTGQQVRQGEPLLALYSPELLASQEEYLKALKLAQELAQSPFPEARKAAGDLLAAARQRLLLFDVPDGFLASLEQAGSPQRTVTLLAPIGGVVLAKNVYEGQRIEPGTELFTVADLSRVWVEAQIYERELASVAVGTSAAVILPYPEAPSLVGKVRFVYPTVEPQTRTVKVRLELPNPEGHLKPEMYATVELHPAPQEGVLVPDAAVMDTGTRRLVFVEQMPGFFVPREVELGASRDGTSLVKRGLSPGERVAVQGTFLLDSESRLRAALSLPQGGSHAQAHH
jgi:Cu(I)/Ag(I) efflux system membrane fusion protein